MTPTPANPDAVPVLACLTVDLAALAANYATLRRLAPASEIGAVVKANAYGLGVAEVARALAAHGCGTYFVATVQEALELRRLLAEPVIYTLGGVPGGGAAALAAARIRPVLNCIEDARAWARDGRGLECALQIDTGLTRAGFDAHELDRLYAEGPLYPRLNVGLLLTHLASADDPGSPQNARQQAAFEALRARFPGLRTSCANSAGLLLGPAYCGDLVRPGIALYGGRPFADGPNPMQPVVRLEARVLQVRELKEAADVGYGASARVAAGTRLAILGIGYADGYPRSLGGGAGWALLGGVRAAVVGRVSMDLLTVDASAAPDVAVGDVATLIGPGVTLEAVAEAAGTVGYEILTGIGARVERVYTRVREHPAG